MKIAILITHPDNVGGGHVHVRDLASALISRGHAVKILVGQRGPFTDMLSARQIPFQSLSHLQRAINPINDLRALIEIRNQLATYKPDLVSCHSSKAGWLGRIAAGLEGIPAVFTAHGWAFSEGTPPVRRILYKWAELLAARSGNRIIAVSEYDRQLAVRTGITNYSEVDTVLNGIPDTTTQYLGKTSAPPVRLIMVARLAPQKNHAGLLRSLARLTDLEWTMDLVGDGPLLTDLRLRSKALGIADRIRFLGYIHDPARILASCDIFLLHTHWEGLPLSILEAMRAGLPVIATDVGGISEAVRDGETGYLVPSDDSCLLEYRLRTLITDEHCRTRLGEAGRARYEQYFTLDRMVAETVKIYEKSVKLRK